MMIDNKNKFLNMNLYLKAIVCLSMLILIVALSNFFNLWYEGVFEQNNSTDSNSESKIEKLDEKLNSDDFNKIPIGEIAEILDQSKDLHDREKEQLDIPDNIGIDTAILIPTNEENSLAVISVPKIEEDKGFLNRTPVDLTYLTIEAFKISPQLESAVYTSTCSHDNGSRSDDPWLIRHQEKDGHWSAGIHDGIDSPEIDCAVTAAALLSLLSAGHTEKAGRFKRNVKSALEWIINKQNPDGSLGTNNYINAICTSAITEATGMGCGGEKCKLSAERAIDFLLKQQNPKGLFDYFGPSSLNDMSVSGWCIFALKSGILAGIKENEIQEALLKCSELLDATEGTSDNSSSSAGLAWYLPFIRGSGNAGGACQAIAMLIRQYTGWNRDEPWLQAAAAGQISDIPETFQNLNIYRTFFTTFVLFQQGGKVWNAWHKPITKIIIESQRKDGDFKGSWDNNGSTTDVGGRVLNTALLNITLELYYRYHSVMN